VIRDLAPGDSLADLTSLLHRAYAPLAAVGLNYTATDQDEATTRRRRASGRCLVDERDGRVVGTVTVRRGHAGLEHDWFRRPDVWSFEQFAVDPGMQGAGIGAALLAAVEDAARRGGASEVACDTAEPARHLVSWYERLGYRFVARTRWPGKTYESLILSKRLAGPVEPDGRPEHWGVKHGSAFLSEDVAAAYRSRPAYPAETFDALDRLRPLRGAKVLDLGCGLGDLARPLAARGASVDAVDVSAAMVGVGRSLEGGDDPRIRWIVSPAEDAPLSGPYDLVTAGASLHWMEWDRLFPRILAAAAPHARLAILYRADEDVPWKAAAREIVKRVSANRAWKPVDLVEEVERRGWFRVEGRLTTAPVTVDTTVDALLDAFHSMSGLTRGRIGPVATREADEGLRRAIEPHVRQGRVRHPLRATLVWGTLTRR
jgi:SAM-dependent methyltransferase/GNAT superfamily N-acetyltransferase